MLAFWKALEYRPSYIRPLPTFHFKWDQKYMGIWRSKQDQTAQCFWGRCHYSSLCFLQLLTWDHTSHSLQSMPVNCINPIQQRLSVPVYQVSNNCTKRKCMHSLEEENTACTSLSKISPFGQSWKRPRQPINETKLPPTWFNMNIT